jgi:hypothetical protein
MHSPPAVADKIESRLFSSLRLVCRGSRRARQAGGLWGDEGPAEEGAAGLVFKKGQGASVFQGYLPREIPNSPRTRSKACALARGS